MGLIAGVELIVSNIIKRRERLVITFLVIYKFKKKPVNILIYILFKS